MNQTKHSSKHTYISIYFSLLVGIQLSSPPSFLFFFSLVLLETYVLSCERLDVVNWNTQETTKERNNHPMFGDYLVLFRCLFHLDHKFDRKSEIFTIKIQHNGTHNLPRIYNNKKYINLLNEINEIYGKDWDCTQQQKYVN